MAADTSASTSTQPQPRYAWVVMALLWSMDLAVTLVFFSIGVLLPVWKEDMGVTPLQAGLLASVGFLGFGIMALPAGIWLTRYNPSRVTLACAIGMAILAAFQSVAPTVGLLLIGRFTFVLLAVIRVQVQVIFIQQWFRPTLYATVNSLDFGLRSAAQALTMGATPVLVMLLGSWRHFYMAVAVALVGLSLVWSFLGRQNQPARDTGSAATSARKTNPARILRRSKAVWIMAASQIGAAAAFASFISLFPTYAMERLGLSLTTVGLMMALFPVGAVLGSLSAGPLSQAIGRRKPFVWGPGLFLPVMYSALLWADSAPLSMLLLLAAGFFAMAPPPILATIPFDLKLAPREVAVALGLTRTLFPLGAALGPLLVGTLQELTGSLFLGLIIVAPMAATLFVGGLLLPETGPKGRLTGA